MTTSEARKRTEGPCPWADDDGLHPSYCAVKRAATTPKEPHLHEFRGSNPDGITRCVTCGSEGLPIGASDREHLTNEWFRLHRTWPIDGRDGAGPARAAHNQKVKVNADQLWEIHRTEGHGPFECLQYGLAQPIGHRCICDKTNDLKAGIDNLIADPRWFVGRKAADGELVWITDPEHPYFRSREGLHPLPLPDPDK